MIRVDALFAGPPTLVSVGGKPTATGIAKQPAAELWLEAAGVRGDWVVNRKFHGGSDQAAYLYTSPDARAWAACGLQAGPERAYFGENVRLDGLSSADLRPGDRLHLGAVTLEVTAPRFPCAVAAAYLSDAYAGNFVKDFYALRLPGIYVRVLQAGPLRLGEGGTLEPLAPAGTPTLAQLTEMHRQRPEQIGAAPLRRALAAPVSERLRTELQEKLAKLQS